jgi:hypothetical protein
MPDIFNRSAHRYDVVIYSEDGTEKRHLNIPAKEARKLEADAIASPTVMRVDVAQREPEPAPKTDAEKVEILTTALRSIHERLLEARSSGDEWASEFLAEEWYHLVSADAHNVLGVEYD